MSFVNGIYTSNGGKHVEYIMNQIIRKLCAYIKTKKKVDVKIPKGTEPNQLTRDECIELWKNQPEKTSRFSKKK